MHMLEVSQTLEFARRLKGLKDDRTVACIDVRIKRLAMGNLGDVKGLETASAICVSIMGRYAGLTSRGVASVSIIRGSQALPRG